MLGRRSGERRGGKGRTRTRSMMEVRCSARRDVQPTMRGQRGRGGGMREGSSRASGFHRTRGWSSTRSTPQNDCLRPLHVLHVPQEHSLTNLTQRRTPRDSARPLFGGTITLVTAYSLPFDLPLLLTRRPQEVRLPVGGRQLSSLQRQLSPLLPRRLQLLCDQIPRGLTLFDRRTGLARGGLTLLTGWKGRAARITSRSRVSCSYNCSLSTGCLSHLLAGSAPCNGRAGILPILHPLSAALALVMN